ncbi:MAG: PilN domain-containing protein [Gemmatimonadota bacterium]
MAVRNGIRIGIALGDSEVVGVILGGKSAPTAKVAVSLGDEGPEVGAELRRAFGELKAALEAASGRSTGGALVYLALLPPLADARLVPFPPMRKSEVEAVLARDVARYFLGVKRTRVVGVRLPKGNGNGARREEGPAIPVLAAAAPLGLLEATRSALGQTGWRSASFSVAHGAWLESALSAKGAPAKAVVSVIGGTAHVLRLEGADPVAVRQVPSVELAAIADAVGEGGGRVLVLATPQAFGDLSAVMAKRGLTAFRDPEGWPASEEGTAGRAGATDLELVPPTLAKERRDRGRRNAVSLVGAAVVLILASLGAQLWGAHRELGAVQERRASIRPEVAPQLAARDSLNGLTTQIQSMEELSRGSPVWTRSLVELAALLPENTYLTGFFASGDTVELEAAGAQAGEAIQLLREAGIFREIRLQGLVERELEGGETVVERFKLWARLPPAGGEGGGS